MTLPVRPKPMRRHRLLAPLSCLLLLLVPFRPLPARSDDDRWSRLDAVAQEAVDAKNVPGVVFLVSHRDRIVYRKAFGNRMVQPHPEPMTVDTIFDMASLTKGTATASCIMALVEEGKLRLNDPVSKYWPEWGQNGKDKVTIRQVMTHTSGLASWANFLKMVEDPNGPPIQQHTQEVLEKLAAMPLANPTDTKFVYSDLGYITLGEVVRRVSGETEDRYVVRRIYQPLKMRETGYNPLQWASGDSIKERCAPTEKQRGVWLQGMVHDPNAQVMGGVAGHAGLFSTADDMAKFARMLLSSDGIKDDRFPLAPSTIREMTSPHSPAGLPVRALGWDIQSPYSHVKGDLMPYGSFGHTGFTGTFLWVDPYSQTFIVGLSNRVHPDGKGNPLGMWAKASNVVAGIVRPQNLPPRALLTPPVPGTP